MAWGGDGTGRAHIDPGEKKGTSQTSVSSCHLPWHCRASLHHLPQPRPLCHPRMWLLRNQGAPGPAARLKGRGANPALSCPQLPCAHRGSWGASPQLLSPQRGTLIERRDRDFSLLETGQGKVVALSRDVSGATLGLPPQAQPSNTCRKDHCPDLLSHTHIQQFSEGV